VLESEPDSGPTWIIATCRAGLWVILGASIMSGCPSVRRSRLDRREGLSDAKRGVRAGVHPVHVRQQIRESVQQAGLVRTVGRVGGHEVDDGDVLADDELAPLQMSLAYG